VNASGKDSTKLFNAFHKRCVLDEVGAQYAVGVLEDDGENDSANPSQQRPVTFATWTDVDVGEGGGQKHTHSVCTAAELQDLVNIQAIAEESLKRLPPALGAGYINYGSEDEQSIANNISGWARYTMRPRVLRDVSKPDPSTSILGGAVQISFPVVVAPFAGAMAAHPDGERAIAAAARAAGTTYAVPHYSGSGICLLQYVLVVVCTSGMHVGRKRVACANTSACVSRFGNEEEQKPS
jgi:hypothetical protein